MPLSFIVVYKIIDIVFETTLEENYAEGIIDRRNQELNGISGKRLKALSEPILNFPHFFRSIRMCLIIFAKCT